MEKGGVCKGECWQKGRKSALWTEQFQSPGDSDSTGAKKHIPFARLSTRPGPTAAARSHLTLASFFGASPITPRYS